MFGDDDPEEAWDESDARAVKIALLIRILFSVVLERAAPHDHNRVVARIAFGILKAASLRQKATKAEAPSLDALRDAFALLDALEGH